MPHRVVLFSPVREAPDVLGESLAAVCELEHGDLALSFWFYDDNDNAESSSLLRGFAREAPFEVTLLPPLELGHCDYRRTDDSHGWNTQVVDRVIRIKNAALARVLSTEACGIFLLDADILIHPAALEHLWGLGVPIVSEICWSRFRPGAAYMPNAWDVQTYVHRSADSVLRLREPGVYEVGGLAACTLVRREVLERGVSFARIPNLDLWGEDKHFCVRAACNGFKLFVDTHYPAFHIYRSTELAEARRWREAGCPPEHFRRWLDADWERAVRRRLETTGRSPAKVAGQKLVRRGIRLLKRLDARLGT